MPNWAMNELEVKAPNNSELEKFITKMKSACNDDEVLSFQSILPMPEILEDTISPFKNIEEIEKQIFRATGEHYSIQDFEQKYKIEYPEVQKIIREHKLGLIAKEATGYSNWYDWQHDKWGVKWGCSNSTIDIVDENKCLYNFDTPWGTPINWLIYLSQTYPNFNFTHKCADPSMDFHNEYYFEDGKLIEENNLNFEDAVEEGNWGGMEEWVEFLGVEE